LAICICCASISERGLEWYFGKACSGSRQIHTDFSCDDEEICYGDCLAEELVRGGISLLVNIRQVACAILQSFIVLIIEINTAVGSSDSISSVHQIMPS
jgi:hypothetical protein